MNILIDFTQIPQKKVGVGVYAYNLIKWIDRLDVQNRYFILIQNDDSCFDTINNKKITLLKISGKIFRIFFFRIMMEQVYIPFLILKYRINIIHSLHYSFPLLSFKAGKIVTIHDLTFFIFPELHVLPKRFYFRFFTQMAARYSDQIICVSKSTKNDLLTYTNVNENKINVIHLGIDPYIPNISQEQKINTLNKYRINSSKKLILFIGTLEPRKNITTILKTFDSFQQTNKNYQLIIVGGKGWYYTDLFKLAGTMSSRDILFTGFIDEFEKQILLSCAHIFVYPSIYEGFGIPVLESLLHKIPTITSKVSSLPEVAGEAALLIDPTSGEEMLSAFIKLADDQNERDLLTGRCQAQVEKFSWTRMAQETITLYNSTI